ncbi:hypothetical protein TNCV_4571061 [Trichonephila clavipes]|nr:hypothetical protein TNCV_4571061 [Trichonephila clavipes]
MKSVQAPTTKLNRREKKNTNFTKIAEPPAAETRTGNSDEVDGQCVRCSSAVLLLALSSEAIGHHSVRAIHPSLANYHISEFINILSLSISPAWATKLLCPLGFEDNENVSRRFERATASGFLLASIDLLQVLHKRNSVTFHRGILFEGKKCCDVFHFLFKSLSNQSRSQTLQDKPNGLASNTVLKRLFAERHNDFALLHFY